MKTESDKSANQPRAIKSKHAEDHVGAIAQAFFIANLLFIGVFYILLWGLYYMKYKSTSAVSKHHLKQTLIASSISTFIAILLNVIILLTTGYASATALILAEVYLMLIVPIFFILGILGFTKAIQGLYFTFPLMGRFANEH